MTRHTDGFWNFSLFWSYLTVDLFFILSGLCRSLCLSGGPAPYAPYIGLSLDVFLVALSWWLEKIYDIPVRRWATRKLRSGR